MGSGPQRIISAPAVVKLDVPQVNVEVHRLGKVDVAHLCVSALAYTFDEALLGPHASAGIR